MLEAKDQQQAAAAEAVEANVEAINPDQEEVTEVEVEVVDPQAAALEAARKLANDNHERYMRVQADYDNFRRRSRQEKEDFAKYASVKLIEQLLPIVDNFERALVASKSVKDFEVLIKGIEMTAKQLDQVLESEGLKAIESVNQPFNPDFHQAIMQVDSEDHEEGTIVEEIQKGYMLKDKVIRPAMVKVST
ncbi:nucleotide exchange factor GrpE [Paenibacillus psychroresistens]|uniref:Protein GrpE n=1 Tax=Paenibacillus psychroresistens TaxID=1778678 RepID=A0A6B8RJC8_9BACL|nr:nucleotide exchange factor GrpE [Paenibacillus psychroresistens]